MSRHLWLQATTASAMASQNLKRRGETRTAASSDSVHRQGLPGSCGGHAELADGSPAYYHALCIIT
jgi:hypothetical protein